VQVRGFYDDDDNPKHLAITCGDELVNSQSPRASVEQHSEQAVSYPQIRRLLFFIYEKYFERSWRPSRTGGKLMVGLNAQKETLVWSETGRPDSFI
jgi:hypothetical protein